MQLSAYLKKAEGAIVHWCPACAEKHVIPISAPYKVLWTFNGDVLSPTFTPSVRLDKGNDYRCHYNLEKGILKYCADSTHELRGRDIPLPPFP
jgi:hypothetical protein